MRRIGDYNEEDSVNWFKRQTIPGLLLKIGAPLLGLILVCSCIGFANNWFRTGVNIISPDNVKAQWQFAYDFKESLQSTTTQWCSLKAAEDAATDPDVKSQRTTQRIAQEQNYARLAAQYDARLEDAFRAKWVKPDDVPAKAPTLAQMAAGNAWQGEVGCQ